MVVLSTWSTLESVRELILTQKVSAVIDVAGIIACVAACAAVIKVVLHYIEGHNLNAWEIGKPLILMMMVCNFNTMDGKDYIQTMEVYGSLTDAGEHSMGVASLILGLLTLLSAAWGYLIYSRGSIAGDPVADNVMFRIAAGFFMGMVMIELLSQVMGFNL